MLPMKVKMIKPEELNNYNEYIFFAFCNEEFYSCFGYSGKTIKTKEYSGKCHIANLRKLFGSELRHVLSRTKFLYVIEEFTYEDNDFRKIGGFAYEECKSITPNAECDW